MKTIKEIIETVGEVVGRGLSVSEITGTYTKKWSGKNQYGPSELGVIDDGTETIGFFVPKKLVGTIPNGTEITILDGIAECGEYKEKLQYTMNMKGAAIEILRPHSTEDLGPIPEETLSERTTGRAIVNNTAELRPAYPKPSTAIDGERVDMALFKAITAIENHKDKIKELIEAGVIKPIELNALTATVLIDNKR